MYIQKASGRKEHFDRQRIVKSVRRAGGSDLVAQQVASNVSGRVRNGMPSQKVLQLVLKELQSDSRTCARYDLKRAIMQLGPTGFPFEQFIAQILEAYGYTTTVGKIFRGTYITHEVDVFALKDKRYLVECKFHNAAGIHTGVKTALYIQGRFLDLRKEFDTPWIVTNTQCSPDVRTYARGVGMTITSWSYPFKNSLRELIERKKLYPITIVRSVQRRAKDQLLRARIMFAKDLLQEDVQSLHRKTGLSQSILNKILQEVRDICDLK